MNPTDTSFDSRSSGMVLILALKSGQKKIVPFPSGADPEEIMATHKALYYEVCGSWGEAEAKIANDPNGKDDWI